MDALLNFEFSDRFGGIGGLVNVDRHRGNLRRKRLTALLFEKKKVLRRRITLGNRCLCCRLAGQVAWSIIAPLEDQTWNQHSRYRKVARFISRIVERQSAAWLFFDAPLSKPPSCHPTPNDARSRTRTSAGGFIPTTGGNLATHLKIDMSQQNGQSGFVRRRRRKVIAFIISEALAIGGLLLTGTLALLSRRGDANLILALNFVTIVAAAAVALIPIIFFAVAPLLPRAGR
jgi:hypothetical protein